MSVKGLSETGEPEVEVEVPSVESEAASNFDNSSEHRYFVKIMQRAAVRSRPVTLALGIADRSSKWRSTFLSRQRR